jgi:hypothetical protein
VLIIGITVSGPKQPKLHSIRISRQTRRIRSKDKMKTWHLHCCFLVLVIYDPTLVVPGPGSVANPSGCDYALTRRLLTYLTLKMGAAHSSETSITIYQSVQRHIPEGHYKDIKSEIPLFKYCYFLRIHYSKCINYCNAGICLTLTCVEPAVHSQAQILIQS